MTQKQTIPVVDLNDFRAGTQAQRDAFVQTVGDALRDLGFFALENHGIDQGLVDRGYGVARQFFELDQDTKRRYEKDELKGQRGFVDFGKEHAKDSAAPDLKEFWHVGRADNIWPSEISEFKNVMNDLYAQIDDCAMTLLQACALYLGEPVDLFKEMATGGESLLRVIHYPPVPEGVNPASIRAAAHEDINLITLLVESTAEGLELLQRDGQWRPIHALHGQIVVDTGDMMQNVTNGILRSTTHRVVNPDNDRSRRFSMPFFVHPRPEVSLAPLASCVDQCQGEKKFPDMTAKQYLQQRLAEIGLS